MDAATVIVLARTFGVTLSVRDGSLSMEGDAPAVYLAAIRDHSEEIISLLTPVPVRQWLWRDGHVYTGEGGEPEGWHPTGSWWSRWKGEAGWRLIESRIICDTPAEMREHVCVNSIHAMRQGACLPAGHVMASASGA